MIGKLAYAANWTVDLDHILLECREAEPTWQRVGSLFFKRTGMVLTGDEARFRWEAVIRNLETGLMATRFKAAAAEHQRSKATGGLYRD